jgi:uncharacterized membrane protein (DUF106 family)
MFPIAALLSIGEKVLDKVLPDPEARAKAQAMLIEMQQKGELAKLQADMNEQDNLTKRAEADMKSDSWLSKNIRPMTLIYILTAYLALAVMDALGLDISDTFVSLLGQWGMLVMSFYFGGRTLEKVMDMKAKQK